MLHFFFLRRKNTLWKCPLYRFDKICLDFNFTFPTLRLTLLISHERGEVEASGKELEQQPGNFERIQFWASELKYNLHSASYSPFDHQLWCEDGHEEQDWKLSNDALRKVYCFYLCEHHNEPSRLIADAWNVQLRGPKTIVASWHCHLESYCASGKILRVAFEIALGNFQTIWKISGLSRWSRKDSLESCKIVWIFSGWSGKFPDSPDIFQMVQKVSG